MDLSPDQQKQAIAVYRGLIVITAHDHCFDRDDFRDMEAGGITVRTIKLTTDGIYWHDNEALSNRESGGGLGGA